MVKQSRVVHEALKPVLIIDNRIVASSPNRDALRCGLEQPIKNGIAEENALIAIEGLRFYVVPEFSNGKVFAIALVDFHDEYR